MGFADELVADLKSCGAPEEPDPAVLADLLERWEYSFCPSGPGYPKDLIREEIIIQLALPVHKLVLRYRNRNNADDILGEALLALIECVDRWRSCAEDNNIRRYVEFSVRKRIKDFIDNDAVFKVPSRRVREKAAAGEVVEEINTFRLDPHDEEEGADTPVSMPDVSYDVLEFFESRGDPRDSLIIRMRAESRSLEEIAEQVGRSVWWVFDRLQRLESDYLSDTPSPARGARKIFEPQLAHADVVKDETLLKLERQGLPPKQIALRVGRSLSWVHQRLSLLEWANAREGAKCKAS